MNIFKFTLIDLWRTKTFFGILFLSLLVAFTSVSYLYFYGKKVYSRFDKMPELANMIVGAKSSDHKIVLGSLAGVDYKKGYIPYTLYKSFQDNMSVRHADGELTHSQYIKKIAPILHLDKINEFQVVATNKELFEELDSSGEIIVGDQVAKSFSLNVGDDLVIPELNQKLRVKKVLHHFGNIFDNQIFIDIEFYYSLNLKPNGEKTIWGNRVLHFMLANVTDSGIEEFRSLVNQRTVAQVVVKSEVLEDIQKLLANERKIINLMANLIIFLSILSIITVFLVLGSFKKSLLKSLKLMGYSKSERIFYIAFELSFIIFLPLILGSVIGHFLLVMIFPSSLF